MHSKLSILFTEHSHSFNPNEAMVVEVSESSVLFIKIKREQPR